MKLWKVVTRDRKSIIIKREGYVKTYAKGTTVNATKDSIGLLCFNDIEAAGRFRDIHYDFFVRDGIIIEVEPIGDVKEPPDYIFAINCGGGVEFSDAQWAELEQERNRLMREHGDSDRYMAALTQMAIQKPPNNTVVCDSVKVLT